MNGEGGRGVDQTGAFLMPAPVFLSLCDYPAYRNGSYAVQRCHAYHGIDYYGNYAGRLQRGYTFREETEMNRNHDFQIVNTSTAHQANRKTLLACIRSEGPLSRAELARKLHVPSGTISRVSKILQELGLLREQKEEPTGQVGRPPILLDMAPDFGSFLGIEFGPLLTRVLATDFRGAVLWREARATNDLGDDPTEGLADYVVELVSRNFEGSDLPPLRGVGCGISGSLSRGTGEVIRGFLPDGVRPGEALEDAVGVPVCVENDANLAVVAEMEWIQDVVPTDVVCLLDRGWVGAGLYINGALYRGWRNVAGELSASIDADSAPFLESFTLERILQEQGRQVTIPPSPPRTEKFAELAAATREGDRDAEGLLRYVSERFARALYRLALLFDPQLLVVSGDWTETGELGEELLTGSYEQLWEETGYVGKLDTPEVRFSRLGQDAVTLGACAAIMDRVSSEVIED